MGAGSDDEVERAGQRQLLTGEHIDPHRLTELLRAVMTVGSDLDLDATLRRIVEAAASLVGARYGALGVIDETGTSLARFITVGVDDAEQSAIGTLPKGLGLLGVLITDARPLRVADLGTDPSSLGFPPGHPPMKSFLGVPVRVRDEVFGSLYLTDKITGGSFSDIDEDLAAGLAVAAGVAIDHARLFEQVERQRLALEAVHEVATAFVAGTDSRETLQLVARHARELVGADLATIALPVAPGDTMVIEVADGADSATVSGQRFPRDGSISGDVLRSGETAVLEDLSQDHRMSQPQVREGHVGPGVFVALLIDGRPFGTLCVARHRGGALFTTGELALIETFAAHAGVVVGHEQNRQQRARVNSLEEQERIARNLHDTVIQRLFAAGLTLQAAHARPEDVARERMIDVIEELDDVIKTIRTLIFDVHSSSSDHLPDPRQQILELTHELAPILNLEPAVAFAGPVATGVAAQVVRELLVTLREALTNVARHAHAEHVRVEVKVDSGLLTLQVADDGIGIPSLVADRRIGLGIANIDARARQLGGDFTIDPLPTAGTCLRWRVPCGD